MADTNEVFTRRRFMRCTSSWAPRWCHSPAMTCPCSILTGILKEHLHTREKAGLFDVSHMGQAFLSGDDPAKALERLTPADVIGLKDGLQRYGLLLNDTGTIKDDFMFSRLVGEARPLSRRERRHQARRFRIYRRETERYRDTGTAARSRIAGAAGARGGSGSRAACARHFQAHLHEGRALHRCGRAGHRQPFGLHRRRRF